MRKVTIGLVVLGVLALAFISMPMRAQNQGYAYPPEFSPLRTYRTPPAQGPLVPATKFVKVGNAIPNKYIVVLNDDLVSNNAPVNVRRAQVSAIANSLAQVHGGKRGFVYETALKGFSIELPNEAAAIALSQNPQVKWVEEDGLAQLEGVQNNPPWGLDRIDQIDRLPACGPNGTPPCGIDSTSTSATDGISIYPGATYTWAKTGAGVNVYVIDTGINADHVDFGGRAYRSTDCSNSTTGIGDPTPGTGDCVDYPVVGSSTGNNDLSNSGHGTHVAGIVGATTFGVAKGVNIRSVRQQITSPDTVTTAISSIVAGVNWVTRDHNANPSIPAVANLSSGCSPSPFGPNTDQFCGSVWDNAVQNSINAGVTYTIAAGNGTENGVGGQTGVGVDVMQSHSSPADVVAALTVGAMQPASGGTTIYSDIKPDFSNFGSGVDVFAPGLLVRSASKTDNTVNTGWSIKKGTSQAAPHVAGAVALYLQDRTGASGCDCFSLYNSKVPNNSLPASSYAKLSTCPDRVAQFIKSNATLNDLQSDPNQPGWIGSGSPNRLLFTGSLANPPTNPIDNQRFFVWQHYADFLPKAAATPVNNCDSGNPEKGKMASEPNESGLDFWTSQITATCGTGTDFNANNACTPGKRVDVSRAFWVAVYPSWFNTGPNSLTNFNPAPYATPNEKWLDEVYWVYLRRRPPHSDPYPVNWDPGFKFWFDALNSGGYGNPANQAGVDFVIKAFIESLEYRERSGQP